MGNLGKTIKKGAEEIKKGADEIISTMDATANGENYYAEPLASVDDTVKNGKEFRLIALQKDRSTFIEHPKDIEGFKVRIEYYNISVTSMNDIDMEANLS